MPTNYRDRIGDRLDNTAEVPAEFLHLIPDDRQRVRRILEFPVSGRVLDVGCSDGAITRRILERWAVDITGVDVRPPYQPGNRPLNWPVYLQWDIRDPWGKSNPWYLIDFDVVYVCEVFEHLTDADASLALQNVLAVLKPGGDLVVTVPNRHPHDLYEVGCRSRWAWPDHRSAYTRWRVERFLGAHFERLEFVPLYDDEIADVSIWLIVRASGKR